MRKAAPALSLAFIAILAGCDAGATGRQRAAAAESGGNPQSGKAAVSKYGCGSCHTIPGVAGANGRVGPSLAGIADQLYVAGQLANTPVNLMQWIRHPKSINEKTLMPELGVTPDDAKDIAALLYTLK